MATETKTFYPSAYDASDYKYNFVEDMDAVVGKGSGNVSSYATIALTIGSTAITYVFFPFDLSAIPQDATIDSVSCKARGATNSSTYSRYRHANFQLYSGSVAKGTLTTYLDTYSAVYTLDVGTWTRAELNDCRLRVGAVRGSTNVSTTYAIYFYGADLTVTYTYQSEKFMLKLGGAWHDIARVFKKVNGIWVEQTDLANVVDQTKRLFNGGFYEMVLPEGYTKLEYIESTGQQWFNTGFMPNQNTRFVLQAQPMEQPAVSAYFAFFGFRSSSTYFELIKADSNTLKVYALWSTTVDTNNIFLIDWTERNVFEIDRGVARIGDQTITVGGPDFQSEYPVFLCASNNKGNADFKSKLRIFSCQIYNGDTLVHDYVPAKNASGVVGLFDKCTSEFGASASSTPFKGPYSVVSFTIHGVTYYAEEGMTWNDWVSSEYNTGNFSIQSDRVAGPSLFAYITSEDGVRVKPADTVIPGHVYTLV